MLFGLNILQNLPATLFPQCIKQLYWFIKALAIVKQDPEIYNTHICVYHAEIYVNLNSFLESMENVKIFQEVPIGLDR